MMNIWELHMVLNIEHCRLIHISNRLLKVQKLMKRGLHITRENETGLCDMISESRIEDIVMNKGPFIDIVEDGRIFDGFFLECL
jgi:hypothetical protein